MVGQCTGKLGQGVYFVCRVADDEIIPGWAISLGIGKAGPSPSNWKSIGWAQPI